MDYKNKYLKYKLKYLQLKKLQQYGGARDNIHVLYANVGRDFINPNRDLAIKEAFCDYNNGVGYQTANITFQNLTQCLSHMAGNRIDLLTFNEFCYSKLEDLIRFMDRDEKYNNYDIIIIAQNRDDKIYASESESGLVGIYEQKTIYSNLDDQEKILVRISNPIKIKGTYRKECKDDKYFARYFVKDSYYKCYGFIYDKTQLIFNEEKTVGLIQTIPNISAENTYQFESLEVRFSRPHPSFTKMNTPKRIINVIRRYDYLVGTLDKTISDNILQYCAFSCFTNLSTGLEFILYNTHFMGTLENDEHNWIEQYTKIIKFIKMNNHGEQTIIIGDFNIRSKFVSVTLDIAQRRVSNLISRHDLEPKFSNHIILYDCSGHCENTMLIRKELGIVSDPNVCTDITLDYNCHKPVLFTILGRPPEPRPATGAAAASTVVSSTSASALTRTGSVALTPPAASASTVVPASALTPPPASALTPPPASALTRTGSAALTPPPASASTVVPASASASTVVPASALTRTGSAALTPPPASASTVVPASALTPPPASALTPPPASASTVVSSTSASALTRTGSAALTPPPASALTPPPASALTPPPSPVDKSGWTVVSTSKPQSKPPPALTPAAAQPRLATVAQPRPSKPQINFYDLRLQPRISKSVVDIYKKMNQVDIKRGRYNNKFLTEIIEELYGIKLRDTDIGFQNYVQGKKYYDYETKLFEKLKKDISAYKP